MARVTYKVAIQCSLLVLWKQFVSEVGTTKQMCFKFFFVFYK